MTPKTLARRVSRLEQADPSNRGMFLYVENNTGETPAEAEARCRREQDIPEDLEPDVMVAFIGLHG